MAKQGGTHEQHVKAGQQGHKNSESSSSSHKKADAGARGGNHDQQSNAGKQSHKNGH